jgi:hypothetical protein
MPRKNPKSEAAIESNKRWRERNREQLKAKAAANREKTRAYCRDYHWKNREEILARKRAYWHANKERLLAEHMEWYRNNREKVIPSRKRYQVKERLRYATDPEWRKKRQQVCKDHAKNNPEWYRAWSKMDRERNPGKYENYRNVRRARKLGASVGTDREAYKHFIKVLKTTPVLPCYWCGKDTKPGKRRRHIDHIIALAAGGKDDVYNLCCSCPSCNHRKSDKRPEDFTGQFVLPF